MTEPAIRVVGSGVAVESPSMFPACVATPSGIVVAYSTVPDGWPGGTIGVRRSANGTWEDAAIVAWPGPGEDAALYETVRAVGMELCPQLGVAIPVGKDSLSMRTQWSEGGQVKIETKIEKTLSGDQAPAVTEDDKTEIKQDAYAFWLPDDTGAAAMPQGPGVRP